ncbi:MAG: hypothetical protein RB191_10955 [Terriglobia bacterium]|nr:hypothetical protein [Terriglobia bacterium]
MTNEIICPRKDLPAVAAELYRALKSKPCRCERAWTKDGYVIVKQCAGCAALDRYEALTEVSR